MKTMLRPAVTLQYPHVKPDLPARTRGVIALKQENCTVCYKCSRECPDWCIYIDAHKEAHEPAGGGRARRRRSSTGSRSTTPCACTAASASRSARSTPCSGAPSSSTREYEIDLMTHEKDRLEEWTYTVLPPPALEVGAERGADDVAAEEAARDRAGVRVQRAWPWSARSPRSRVVTARNVVHAALYLVVALLSVAGMYLLLGAEFVAWVQILDLRRARS